MNRSIHLVSALSFFVSGLHAQTYTLKDLGTLGGPSSNARAINASGTVVGAADTKTNLSHATLFSGTGVENTDLDPLSTSPAGSPNSRANAINDSGAIVGLSNGATLFKASTSSKPTYVTLAGPQSFATGINSSGTSVGQSYFQPGSFFHATAFGSNGASNTDLSPALGTTSIAFGIHGTQIVGQALMPGNTSFHAARFGSGVATDLGTLGGTYSSARAVNASGVIVGEAFAAFSYSAHATRFSGTGTNNIDLGTLGGTQSHANGINASGIIVGTSDYPGDAETIAFVYRDDKMIDLNSLIPEGTGVVLSEAVAINDKGQIAANGKVGANIHAFRLDPVLPPPTSFKITATANPSGKGTVKGAGTFKKGRTVTLAATAKKGAEFVKWTEHGKTVSTSRTYSFKVTKDRKLVARFK